MYANDSVHEDSERTAFRKTEKKYKLYYDSNSKKKKKPRAVDLSEVFDFKSISQLFTTNGDLPVGVSILEYQFDKPVFCLDNCPGFYFIPAALSIEEQCRWIKESLVSFPQPPNRTNHNAFYGAVHDLFNAAKTKKVLVKDKTETVPGEDNSTVGVNFPNHRWASSEEHESSVDGNDFKSISAPVLLRKLRWSTLGLQFDWSKRSYNVSLPHNKIPDALCQLAKKMAAPAMAVGEEFQPEAAIVNYFGSGDMLGGHLDDMEADWSKPIVSISLGCKAIFLLGGKSRNDEPIAMFLRSGDIVLMSGGARERFHGVPRIFTDIENAEIESLEKQLSDEDDSCYLEYIQSSRININIRLASSHFSYLLESSSLRAPSPSITTLLKSLESAQYSKPLTLINLSHTSPSYSTSITTSITSFLINTQNNNVVEQEQEQETSFLVLHVAVSAFFAFVQSKRESWQMWENYSQVAVDNGNFGLALEATQKVLSLTNNKRYDVKFLNDIMLDIEGKNSGAVVNGVGELGLERSRETEQLINLVGKILQQISKSGADGEVWGLFARWHKFKGDLIMCSEALIKQVRSYQGSELWKDRTVQEICSRFIRTV